VLIVVDYAASRADQLRDWIGELADAPAGRTPLDLLPLERQAQRDIGWLATVAGHGHDDRSRTAASLFDPPARKIGALDEDAVAALPPELAGQVRAAWAAAQGGDGDASG
jgi:hypothetical protein